MSVSTGSPGKTGRRSHGGGPAPREHPPRPPRRVLVTGAGSGIGRAVALRYSSAGDAVIAVDIDGDSASATAAECAGAASHHRVDIGDETAVIDLAGAVCAEHGAIDVLVNNAGVGLVGNFLDCSLKDWSWIRSVNLDGVVNMCHAFGPAMVERGSGHVVNIASGLGLMANRRTPLYCATKSAIIMLSECLRADWGRRGVGVSVVCPGVVNTGISTSSRVVGLPPDEHARLLRLFRRARPADRVADAVLRAEQRNSAIVPVGAESSVAYYASRLLPAVGRNMVAKV